MRIAALYRYPVKGLSPEPLARAELTAGGYWPGDRMFAIENGPSGFDPTAPEHQPKIKFLMLMRNETLARLRTRYDEASGVLSIELDGREAARGNLATEAGRAAIEAFFQRYVRYELRGAPKLIAAPEGFRFTDSRSGFVSLINLASVAALEARVGAPIDPLRFRGNLYVEGLEANVEHDWPEGTRLACANGVVFEIVKRTDRCAATNVDPQTGARDLEIPRTLMEAYGHIDCGVYLRIVTGGALAAGEQAELATKKTEGDLPFT